ncbi:hypothetical protein STIUS_v1c04890 [Spiroplasma sp. TIUS-1]|uniref:hypothetical protein n=1 Tax=Spiroplasma sp. TIUS-1 TaxID=216963 RepID=UPI0013970E43|nr:hypothetical protein [Spiroplasma sp. TIUS-1]QHX36043.1 hypothetical protein STIUS_v1c04890 [Spiroplasma sp. TIUS-1]
MKKLLKLLFISTMATIPLSSSIILTACNFSLGDTEIAISGVNNNAIYIDAQEDPTKQGETSSPRSNNKIVDIKIKNPLKGYVIRWKITGNDIVREAIEGGEEKAQLIGISEISNEPGSSNVSLRIFSDTWISKDIENATIDFEYWNESTKTSIVPDIKNKSFNVQVHQVEVKKALNPVDISNMKIPKNNVYNFDPTNDLALVNKETFLSNYVVNLINRKITYDGTTRYDFELGTHYDIFLNGVKWEQDQKNVQKIVDNFYNLDSDSKITVLVKSTGKSTPDNWTVKGEYSYFIKHDENSKLAPAEPGGRSPEDEDRNYKLDELSITNYKYNFKDMDDDYKVDFPINYVKNYIEDIVSEFSQSELKAGIHYTVMLDNGETYYENFWDDKEQQEAISSFFKKIEEYEVKEEVVNFKIEPIANKKSSIIVTGEKGFSFIHNETYVSAPKYPGKSAQEDWISIPFNFMFEGAKIDLSKMGGQNKDTTLLKQGLGGLILDQPIVLSSNADIKSSITKGFDVFHGEITKPETIEEFVINKPIGNSNFDNNIELRKKFAEIIKDKNNWTMNWWKHMGEAGTVKPGKIPDNFKSNQISTISYALTVSAKKELESLKILPRTDSFQFPMWVSIEKNPTEKWDDYFGHQHFLDHYTNNYMGLIVGNTNEFISRDNEVLPEEELEYNSYENILTQQALGTFNKGGIPITDPNHYLTSGADFLMGPHDKNKYFDFTLQKSDRFNELPDTKSFKNIRAIYGNDILKKVTEIWARMMLSNYQGSNIPANLNAKMEQKQVRVNYDKDWTGNPGITNNTKVIEVGDKLIAETLPEKDKIQVIDNAYFLDLTSEIGFSSHSGSGPMHEIDFANNEVQKNMFNKILLDGNSVPKDIESWGFLDKNNVVGATKEQEQKWLNYNVYNITNNLFHRNSLTIPSFKAEQVEIFEQGNTNDNAMYLHVKTWDVYGNSSEMYDKSIRHVIIKINKK